MITKGEAITQGLKYYWSDTPCKRHGHVGYRYTSNSGCVECTKTEQRKTGRNNWRSSNTERIKKKDKEYAEQHKEQISQYHKNRYATVLREQRLQKYREWKQEQSAFIRNLYSGKDILWPNVFGTEDSFKNYITWRIVNELQVDVMIEYSPLCDRKRGQIDIFIPLLGIGVEVKLDAPYWSPITISRQVAKYERWLGEGNVYVVSPSQRWGISVNQLIDELKTRLVT